MLKYCQSSVVCVMCSRLLCPYLVCFLSLLSVIISSFLSSCVCDLSCVFIVLSVQFDLVLVYSLLPSVPVGVSLALSCPALPCLSTLKTAILSISSSPCSSFVPRVCTVTRIFDCVLIVSIL